MPTTTDPSDNSGERHQRSRLEAEIEEILARAERDNPLPPPIPFEKRRRAQRPDSVRSEQLQGMATSVRKWLIAVPILTAYGFAIVAFLFSDISSVITRTAVSLAVIAVFWPIIEHFRNRNTGSAPSQMWRGRDMRPSPPDTGGPTPWEHLRQWLRNRRMLP